MGNLKEIYRPIEKEMIDVEGLITSCLNKANNDTISQINRYCLESPGKRIRPALVILSSKAAHDHNATQANGHLVSIAAAIELIHMASLVHDDVIDKASLRHNRPTVNSLWGQDISIALGNYFYTLALKIISECGNAKVIKVISSMANIMSEGELLQVCERDNLDLLRELYLEIVRKKTAALFSASCEVGVIISCLGIPVQSALKEYGLNFGIAFQIIDDYLDLVSEEQKLGKVPGEDLRAGEVTLPLLNLWESVPESKKSELKTLLSLKKDSESLQKIKTCLQNSQAFHRTKETVLNYVTLAKDKLDILSDSPYKNSLLHLTDFIMDKGFNGKDPGGSKKYCS